MTLYRYKGTEPKLGSGSYVSDSADVIGRVTLGLGSSIWFNCVLRGDINDIIIGDETNIQDLSVLHVVEALPLHIGNQVTVGHKVTLHACTIEDNCLIGMGAIILDGARIRKNSLVAAGSVVPPGKDYPEESLIMGSPAKVVRRLRPEEIEKYGQHYLTYVQAKDSFINHCEKI
jgi:carbonic anhydrase/acetyltransferase-like protein (isoleucine patch superfamily)